MRDTKWRRKKRRAINAVFASAKRGESTSHESPSGRYRLDAVSWSPTSGWGYTEGIGFCWAQHHLAPNKEALIVDGCYWACPYELVAFDFSRPLELPYEELQRWNGDLAEVHGFDDDGTLTWTIEREVRLSDGKPYDDLTESEEAELVDDDGKYRPGLLGTLTYRATWNAGQPFESTSVEPIPPD